MRTLRIYSLSKSQSHSTALPTAVTVLYARDPQNLFILRIKVCSLLPTSPSFPRLPAPGHHTSPVSMSLTFFLSHPHPFFLKISHVSDTKQQLSTWPISLSTMPPRFIYVVTMERFLLRLNHIPLYVYMPTSYLHSFIHCWAQLASLAWLLQHYNELRGADVSSRWRFCVLWIHVPRSGTY